MDGVRLLALLVLTACDAGGVLVSVDVRTDLAPGVEFTRIVTTAETDPEAVEIYEASIADDFVNGERVAEIEGARPGSLRLSVALYDGDALVLERPILTEIDASRAITILMTRDCRDVGCGEGEACWGGRCVEESCTESCAEECARDDDCAPMASCTEALCDDGACVYPIRAGACAPPAICNPEVGCEGGESDAGMPDAGMRDAGTRDAGMADAGMPDAGMPDAGMDAGPSCGAGELYCGACVDPLTDEAHCGTCGAACSPPNTCWDGACGLRELAYWLNDRRAVARMCGAMSMPAVAALTWDDRIATANQRHANDMAARDLMTGFYTGTDGSTPQSRLTPVYTFNWEYQQTFASDPSELLPDIIDQLLTDSADICRWLMAAEPIHVGAGAAIGASGTHYWAFQLARPG